MGMNFSEEYMTHVYTDEDESDLRNMDEQNRLLHYIDNNNTPSLDDWLNNIRSNVEITVNETDDGDRDNIMYNLEFVKHFMRLCKLLPLWSGISCRIFSSPCITSSSSSAEGYFKDLKLTLKGSIPCTADVFVQKHIDNIDVMVITGSQKYAELIGLNVDESSNMESTNTILNAKDLETQQDCDNFSHDEQTNDGDDDGSVLDTGNQSGTICIACRDGNLPTGAHTCNVCHKNVHILDGCSFSIGSDEGYGSQRICVACHQKKDKSAKAQNIIEMNYEDIWARKPRVKRSKYLQPNPLFNIMSETK